MDLATRKMVYYGLLGLLIAGSTITIFRVAPRTFPVPFLAKDGTFAVYFSGTPSSNSSDIQGNLIGSDPGDQVLPLSSHLPHLVLLSVNVTIDSISFHDNEGNDSGWNTYFLPSPVTINLLQPTSVPVLLDSVHISTQNVTMVTLHVSNPIASINSNGIISTSLLSVKVPSNTLKISLASGARVDPQKTTNVIAVRPHLVLAGNSGKINVTPDLEVQNVSGPE